MFARGKNHNPAALKRVIEYVTKEEKTNVLLTYGKDVNPTSTVKSKKKKALS